MPSQVHCTFGRSLDGKSAERIKDLRTERQLESQIGQGEVNRAIERIKIDSTSDIRFPGNRKSDKKSLDSSLSLSAIINSIPPSVL
jgi:hypothetical protein